MEEKDTYEDLRLLFAPGSPLGGARPKASIREKDGHLAIAKFPRKDDETNTVVWEAVALPLAQKSGIPVPQSRVENIAGKPAPPATLRPPRRTAYPVPLRDEHARTDRQGNPELSGNC